MRKLTGGRNVPTLPRSDLAANLPAAHRCRAAPLATVCGKPGGQGWRAAGAPARRLAAVAVGRSGDLTDTLGCVAWSGTPGSRCLSVRVCPFVRVDRTACFVFVFRASSCSLLGVPAAGVC